MPERLRAAIAGLLRRRAPRGHPPLALPGRAVYILPTGPGALFGALLLVMLAGATHYGNNLAFALTYWLAAAALVSMHGAHRNLAGVRIEAVTARPVFAGDPAAFEIRLANPARRARRGLRLTADRRDVAAPSAASIAGRGTRAVQVRETTRRRGRLPCPGLRLESRYPMGLFRCWAHFVPEAEVLVYPTPIDHRGTARRAAAATARARPERTAPGDAEFFAHRAFHAGDSPRHIDWKASARADRWLVKTRRSPRPAATIWLDYHTLEALDHEARLSQLAHWVIEAARANRSYGLRLPHRSIAVDRGHRHERACLEALALAP